MSDERPTVLAVDVPDDVATAIAGAGFALTPAVSLDHLEIDAGAPPVAVVVGGTLRHVGLAELGVPVLVVVAADDAGAIEDAVVRGAHDVVRRPAPPAEVAARVRAAARLADAHRAARDAARLDELTGLVTRRHLDEHLEMVASMARRLRTSFSLLLVDVDRTRRLNDEHGHAAGDAVVAEVARRIAASLRSEDVAGRWGGDEYLVLLPHTPLDGAWRLADRIRTAVSDEPVAYGDDGADTVVTVSIGCAEGYGDDVEDQLRRAAQALDEAKQAGRNKVVAG